MEILVYEKHKASRLRRLQIRLMRKDVDNSYNEINGQDSVDSVCLSSGFISLRGRRRKMEDAVTVIPGFVSRDTIRYDYFAVYDGHGGSSVAHACRHKLHLLVADEMKRCGPLDLVNWKEVMTASFLIMDGEIGCKGLGDEERSDCDQTVGSTAVVAIVGLESIVVANCGDSRAVISRGGVAIPLSSDHKPERADEMERIEAAGGRVLNWDGYRVLGVLSTSRSIGDHYLKPYVISVPEITVNERTPRDEFLILASDGLWDVMSNEEACEVARRCLASHGTSRFRKAVNWSGASSEAAAVLADFAMARGSSDNISVVVVQLSKVEVV